MPPQAQQSVKARSAKATQDFLAVDGVRDGTIILKTGGLRAVLMASSMNFALKSGDEQEAIIFQYQNFLNSIDFSLQFTVQSRRLNILPYLESLKIRTKEETNELLKIQIDEYVEFVRSFVELSNIVSKAFYIIVPFDAGGLDSIAAGGGGIFSFFLKKKVTATPQGSGDNFEEYKSQLQQRVDQVSLGLVRFGIRTAQLNTEEVIELLYGLYNPGELEKKKLPTA